MADELDKNLEESDAIAEAQMLRPNGDEVAAIKEYCNLVLEKRTLESNSKEELKPMREKIVESKKGLMDLIKTYEDKTFTFSKDKLKEMEQACAAEGLPAVPP
jgi:hypothetical protein